jgi:hypothetical protein
LAEQLAKRSGHEWLNEHSEHVGRISDRVFADALLDHAWGASDVNGYSDLERDREYFAGLAACGVWEYVREERGARTAPDWGRILVSQHRVDEAHAVVEEFQRRVEALKAERAAFMDGDGDPDLDALDLKPLVVRLYKDGRAIARISANLDQAVEELAAARDAYRRAQDDLRVAGAIRVPVSDLLSDAEHEALLERPPTIGEDDSNVQDGSRDPVRDWISCAEAAWAWGISKPQMRNWFKGKGRPPWDAAEIILEISPRKRRLLVDRLDRTRIPPSVMRRINILLCEPAGRARGR